MCSKTEANFEKSWAFLDSTEEAAEANLLPSLDGYRVLTWTLLSAAWFAQFLPVDAAQNPRERSASSKLAGVFLKRVMTDYRAVWRCMTMGYTSQGACIAAALFENALLLATVAESADRAHQVLNRGPEQIPWSVKELCRLDAERLADHTAGEPGVDRHTRIKVGSGSLYATYQWLCQFKHPTIPSALHDSGGTAVTQGQYIIAVAPDTRPEDLSLKKHLLLVSTSRVRDAIEAFLRAHRPDIATEDYSKVQTLLSKANEGIIAEIKAQQKAAPLPVLLPPSKRGIH